eukprot:scaffold49382_cov28-Tisochrysis_lutea.AAC.6
MSRLLSEAYKAGYLYPRSARYRRVGSPSRSSARKSLGVGILYIQVLLGILTWPSITHNHNPRAYDYDDELNPDNMKRHMDAKNLRQRGVATLY